MIYRTGCASAPLPPWQFPELDPLPTPVSTPSFVAADCDGNGAAEARQQDSGHAELSIDEIVEKHVASGYAEGWERGIAEGREKGYAEGIDSGTKMAEQALAAQAERLAAIVMRLSAPITALDRTVEEAVAALALEVARCVIGSETSHSRDYLVQLIRQAIAKVPIEMGALRVVLNPADLEIIRALAPEIEGGGAALVGDAIVEAGDCLVVADGQGAPLKDMRWRPRAGEGMSQVDLSLATRWRSTMLALFEGEDK